MKLREYIENLREFVKENPEALDMDVITSKDDEGNGYNHIYYSPTKGHFDGDDFIPAGDLEEYGKDKNEVNSVCLN